MLKNPYRHPDYAFIYIVMWTVINLTFLVSFPFMHTDESWLAGLSRAIMTERNAAATEPFFDIVHRSPHAIKIFFHALQIPFIALFRYRLFSIRLISLLSGTAVLAVFGNLFKKLGLNRLSGIILLSVQIQFIYASHFGRQEIQILLLMLLSINALYSARTGFRRGFLAGLFIAAAVGFHPNAFIAAWPPGLVLLADIISRKRRWGEGTGFLIPPAVSAAVFLFLSFSFNSSFVSDYGSFGKEVGFFDAFDVKLLGFDDFYRKLFLQVSGTYFTPRIWPVFIIAGASALIAALLTIFSKNRRHKARNISTAVRVSAAGIAGVNIGIIIIGKYSAPSIVFLIPFLIILTAAGIEAVTGGSKRKIAYSAAALLLLLNSLSIIIKETAGREKYSDFHARIAAVIPKLSANQAADKHRVLGPLSAEFALEYGRLTDWRNLTALRTAGMSFAQFADSENIEYIIYTEEYDLIFAQRPVWNVLYGNPTIYHEQLQDFLNKNCELVNEFVSPGYGARIVFHRFKKDWFVRIYRVIN